MVRICVKLVSKKFFHKIFRRTIIYQNSAYRIEYQLLTRLMDNYIHQSCNKL